VKGRNGQTDAVTLAGTNGLSVSAASGTVTVTTNATANNTASTIVSRDASSNFSAGTVTLTGNLALPGTASPGVGVLTLGGTPFLHNFGNGNTFVGASAGNMTMTGSGSNSAFGFAALRSNTTGNDNSAFGVGALVGNTTGNNNAAFGLFALLSNTTGGSNSAFGTQALSFNTTGANNSAFGFNALLANTGNNNAAFGVAALQANTTGGGNAAFGTNALILNTSGANNTALGSGAGAAGLAANTTGSNNTFIGYNSGLATSTQLTNATAIGANALVNCSNCMVLGGAGTNGVTVRWGSETGTAEAPVVPGGYQGLVVRRINSTVTTAGSIVARTDTMELRRDGTNGGMQMFVAGSAGDTNLACLGLDVNHTAVGFTNQFANPAATTVGIWSDSQNVVYISCSFGSAASEGHVTQVTIQRFFNTATWVGTVISTYNQ